MEIKQMTEAGTMTSNSTTGFPTTMRERFERILVQWQIAVNIRHYNVEKFTHAADQVHGHFGAKYARLDIGGSGAFMVDISTGLVYGIMGYGKVDKKKVSGNIYNPNFDGAALVRDRFRYGRFENNADGSLRQQIVSR
jgi:hypothetical protein